MIRMVGGLVLGLSLAYLRGLFQCAIRASDTFESEVQGRLKSKCMFDCDNV